MVTKRVGILIFPDVEVLDFAGPFEVFSATRLDEERRYSESSPFHVFLVAEEQAPVVAIGGMRVLAEFTLEKCPPLDVLVIPGGWGTRALVNNATVVE
jgi:putative intracellular protease/amidase